MEQTQGEIADADQRLAALGCLFSELDGVDFREPPKPLASCDAQGNRETWGDMKRCLSSGQYPAAFRAIDVPVLMLHGAQDAHPGQLIRESLTPHLAQLEFMEWLRCGHTPWLERGRVSSSSRRSSAGLRP
ncbi:MAG: pimeloyl-ACP methyl ester carboxylesterase [Pseudohongiellaceae bacterium]|jgi:pimeloyl-ACP methyl ester carboxylesterase